MIIKRLFMNFFLGTYKSTADHSAFDNFEPFVNKSIENDNHEKFFGYVSTIKSNVTYKGCIIILHGVSDNRKDFLANYHFKNNMRDDYLYVVPEFPGFGESTLPFTKMECYRSILMWMKHIKDDYDLNNFILVGQSFGSTLALDFYNYMFLNEMLDSSDAQMENSLPIEQNEVKVFTCNKDIGNEKFNVRQLILFSPFAVSHIVALQYCKLHWALTVLGPLVKYLINEEITFDLTKLADGLDSSIVTIIYTPDDVEVPCSNSLEIKKNFNVKLIKYKGKNHINLFIDSRIWKNVYKKLDPMAGFELRETNQHSLNIL